MPRDTYHCDDCKAAGVLTQRDGDLGALKELLEEHADELTDGETEAFASMRFELTAYHDDYRREHLSTKQRHWVTSVHQRIIPDYANLVSRGLVPRGREVPTPTALQPQNLPKKPPPRRREE